MARYTGSSDKINRRYGVALFGPSKALERRPYPPGQHGIRALRKKRSDYSIALAEKQKLRFQYGIMEKQFRKYFTEAHRRKGITSDVMIELLESRLDNVCYRIGLGKTRRSSRQFVSHGNVKVNGTKVNISSYLVKPGDLIEVSKSNKSQQLATRLLDLTSTIPTADWISFDKSSLTAKIDRLPSVQDVDVMVNVQLIVELYSR